MFLVCGEVLFDVFVAEQRSDGLTLDARPGGSPFNVAVGLARLGQAVALLTGLSTDRLGTRLAAALEAEGVATDLLVRSWRPSTLSVVDVGPDGAPIYTFYGTGAADRAITEADLPAIGPKVWGVHAGSYSLAVEPVGSSLLAFFAREAGRRLLMLDPNVRLNVEPDVGHWRARVDAFARHSDIIKVSDEDLGLLYPGTDAAEVATRWRAAGVGLVIVTRGLEGAEAFSASERIAVSASPVQVADTVGAGDSFQAAMIMGLADRDVRSRAALDLLDTDALAGLVDIASRAAGLTCTRRGADLPRLAEIDLFI